MKQIDSIAGKCYIATAPNGGTVTDEAGRTLATVEAGEQKAVWSTDGKLYLSDDDGKLVLATFNYALAVAGLLGGGDKLPAGYTLVDFLESTGTQYINTKWTLFSELHENVESGFRVDGVMLSTTNWHRAAGMARNAGHFAFGAPARTGGGILSILFCTQEVNTPNGSEPYVNSRFVHALNYKNSRKSELYTYAGVVTNALKSVNNNLFITDRPFILFGFSSELVGGFNRTACRIWSAECTEGHEVVRNFIPALAPTGVPCMFDRVSGEPFLNSGSGSFIVGVKDAAQLRTVLRKLPATGGSLKLSLPAEANTPEVAEQLQACYDTKGWTITVHEYRPAAAATYSLRRVREVVWCRREQSDLGSYVDPSGTRWQVERCVAIFGALGQDPVAYCYTPFDSVEQAVEFWELAPWVDPNAEPETEPETLT